MGVIDPMTPHDPRERRAWRTDQEWARLSARMATAQPSFPKRRRTVVWATAAAVVIVAAGGAAVARHAIQARALHVVDEKITGGAQTIAGQRTLVTLPDSSVAILGPASTLRYTFNRGARDVVLEGMAEFRVVHDTSRRFSILARNAVVTDIGTEFVVRAYESDSSVRVAVVSGVVSLESAASPDGRILLRANEVGGFENGGRPEIVRAADASRYTEWVGGRLAFENESLGRVAVELSRWFGVNVRVASPALARRRVSGIYAQPTLNHVLDALAASLGATYAQSGSGVVFKERGR
jgi:transmembrane sensor